MPKPAAKPVPQKKPVSIWSNAKTLSWILAAVAALIYILTVSHGYALDDVAVVYENKFVRQGFAGIPKILTTFYWAGYWELNAGLYRPLSLVMFAMEWAIAPDSPGLSHAVNILLYAATAFLLFKVLVRIFKNVPVIFSFAIVLLFVVHPIHTEVVANIKSRDEILCFFFFVLSVGKLLDYIEKNSKPALVYFSIFYLLALLSKEGGLLFLPLYALILYFFRAVSWKKILVALAPVLIISALWLPWHEYVINSATLERKEYTYVDNSIKGAESWMDQRATALTTVLRYIKMLFVPYPLSYDYSYRQIPNVSFTNPLAIFSLAICLLLLVATIKNWKRNKIVSFGILFFIITLSLTSNVVFLIGATMADRFMYVPSLGFCIVVVALLWHYVKSSQKDGKLVYFLSPVFVIFSILTVNRSMDWKDNRTLFLTDVNAVPNSSRAHYNAGTVLMDDAFNEQNEQKKPAAFDKAIKEFEASVKLDSMYSLAWINYGVSLYQVKRYEQSAMATRHAMTINPADSSIFQNLADAYFMMGRYDSAVVYLNKTIGANQISKETYNRLGASYFNLQRFDLSIQAYETAVKRDSTYADVWLNLGSAYGVSGKYTEANSAFEKAYQLNPSNPQPLYFISMTYTNMGDKQKADEYLQRYKSAGGK